MWDVSVSLKSEIQVELAQINQHINLTVASPGDDVYAPGITGHSSNDSHFIETANRNVSRSSMVSI